MKNITTIYKKSMKMSDLIDADFHLLLLLEKLSISLGFGEKSVEMVCNENKFDADCFLFLANYHSHKTISNINEVFEQLPLRPFLYYLQCSHNYFIEERLPTIRLQLETLFGDEQQDTDIHRMVIRFFDKYTKEVLEHMNYEDEVVFPYVESLMNSKEGGKYSIDIFEEVHTDIEGKMNDLIQILMKYVLQMPNQKLLINILLELYITGDELESHKYIEDELVIPKVRRIEER